MPNHSHLAKPLNELMQSSVVYEWTEEWQAAFQAVKDALTQSPILRAPDFSRPFELHTDSAKTGLVAVLNQRDNEGNEFVVSYASRGNKRAESNYSSNESETGSGVGSDALPPLLAWP